MPSLDFVYDAVDKLNDDNIDYLIIAVTHPSEEESRSDIFYNLSDERSPAALAETITKFYGEVLEKYIDDDPGLEFFDGDDPDDAPDDTDPTPNGAD